MKNENLVKNDLMLDINTSISEAHVFFEKNAIHHIPVLDGKKYVGTLFKKDLDQNSQNQDLKSLNDFIVDLYLTEDFTIFDWFKIVSDYRITDIPLVGIDKEFFGFIDFEDFIEKFEKTGMNVNMSSVLTVSKQSDEFSYSEVFQILEANDAKVYGSYINYTDENNTEIILNLHHLGLNEILQSLRRYGYSIVSFHDEDQHHETLKENSEYLSKYLTV